LPLSDPSLPGPNELGLNERELNELATLTRLT